MPDVHQAAVEQVIRDLIADNPDLPIMADFYRGVSDHPLNLFGDRVKREYVTTPACGAEWFVRVLPTSFDVCVSAAGRLFLGAHDVIGDVTAVKLPQTSPGVVDVDALTGSAFHVELLAAVREKAAVVEQMRANVTS